MKFINIQRELRYFIGVISVSSQSPIGIPSNEAQKIQCGEQQPLRSFLSKIHYIKQSTENRRKPKVTQLWHRSFSAEFDNSNRRKCLDQDTEQLEWPINVSRYFSRRQSRIVEFSQYSNEFGIPFHAVSLHSVPFQSYDFSRVHSPTKLCQYCEASQSSEHRYQDALIFESQRFWSCRIAVSCWEQLKFVSDFSMTTGFENLTFSSLLLGIDLGSQCCSNMLTKNKTIQKRESPADGNSVCHDQHR
jgi:hypothetical protein